jgi:hypothetical protein
MTSSSSGHSGDERWYEVMEASESGDSPPPLPVRLGSGGSSAFHQVKQSRGAQVLESSNFPPTQATLQAFPPSNVGFSEFEQQQQQQEMRLVEKVCLSDLRPTRQRAERAMEYLTRAPKVFFFTM